MSMMGGEARELVRLAGGVQGNIAFDLSASSLLWNSKTEGGLLQRDIRQPTSNKGKQLLQELKQQTGPLLFIWYHYQVKSCA